MGYKWSGLHCIDWIYRIRRPRLRPCTDTTLCPMQSGGRLLTLPPDPPAILDPSDMMWRRQLQAAAAA